MNQFDCERTELISAQNPNLIRSDPAGFLAHGLNRARCVFFQVYYISVRERYDSAVDDFNMKKLKKWLNDIVHRRCKLVVFDVRATVKDLRTLFPQSVTDVLFQDVELCHWVYEPCSTSLTLNKLSKMYTKSLVSPIKGSSALPLPRPFFGDRR